MSKFEYQRAGFEYQRARFKFEGVYVNYRHPDPRRGEPRVGSAPNVAFPGNPVDPVDWLQNSVRLKNHCFYSGFGHFLPELGTYFWP